MRAEGHSSTSGAAATRPSRNQVIPATATTAGSAAPHSRVSVRVRPGTSSLTETTEVFGMTTIEESIEVEVPVTTAYNQWTQFEEFPKFMEGVESVKQVSDTRNHWKAEIAGIEREFDTEITEQRPDERIAW